jgi:hypothetical protein
MIIAATSNIILNMASVPLFNSSANQQLQKVPLIFYTYSQYPSRAVRKASGEIVPAERCDEKAKKKKMGGGSTFAGRGCRAVV